MEEITMSIVIIFVLILVAPVILSRDTALLRGRVLPIPIVAGAVHNLLMLHASSVWCV
jgi:Na+/glutamate symporter